MFPTIRTAIVVNPADLIEAALLCNDPARRATFEATQANRDNHRDPFAPPQRRRVRVRAGAPEVCMTVNGIPDFWKVVTTDVQHIELTPLTPSPHGNMTITGAKLPNSSWLLNSPTIKPFGTAS